MKQLLTLAFTWMVLPTFAQTVILSTDFQQGIPANYSIVDNDGKLQLPSGQRLSDDQILKMNYLVQGVQGRVNP